MFASFPITRVLLALILALSVEKFKTVKLKSQILLILVSKVGVL